MTIWNPGFKTYKFFWCGRDGSFSQWNASPFYLDGLMYGCSEQYMMASKATLFDDVDIFNKIMDTESPELQKALGRQVKNFDEAKWNKVAKFIVYRGNYAKYSQNLSMLAELLETQGSLLVEASPYDKVWGIGLTETQANRINWNDWPGKNWLGEMLTKVREDLAKIA